MPPIKLEIEKAGALLEKIILNSNNGDIIVPKNKIISKGIYSVKSGEEYKFKQMLRRAADKKYGGRVGITFSKY